MLNQSTLDHITKKTVSNKQVNGAVFHIESADGSLKLSSAAGNIGTDDRFYIASINKLFISALIHRLRHQNKLSLSDRVQKYLPQEMLQGLLVFKGVDHSGDLTIERLISHTSALPCYLIDKQVDGTKNMGKILNGEDQSWPFEKVVEEVRKMKPKFKPGTAGKASYSETNFRILDHILETILERPIRKIFEELFEELGMKNSFVLPSEKSKHVPVYFKQNQIRIDQYGASTGHDVASTAQDLMIFVKAFFSGYFFPEKDIDTFKKWNNIFFPFKYGSGLQKFFMPRILSPFKAVPEIIGHCGSVGSIAFYIPEKELFITGTVNQTSNQSLVFQALMKLVNKM
jgi:D-alanyl-D-alanine carboxypeptidase